MQDQDREKIRQLLEAALARLDARSEAASASESSSGSGLGAATQPAIQSSGSQHPGLQRFVDLDSDSNSAVPRPCFMEPERECVHSGACEMRGF